MQTPQRASKSVFKVKRIIDKKLLSFISLMQNYTNSKVTRRKFMNKFFQWIRYHIPWTTDSSSSIILCSCCTVPHQKSFFSIVEFMSVNESFCQAYAWMKSLIDSILLKPQLQLVWIYLQVIIFHCPRGKALFEIR